MRLFKSEEGKRLFDFVDEGKVCMRLAEVRKEEYGEMGMLSGTPIYA